MTGGTGHWDKVHGGGYDLQRNGKTVRDKRYVTDIYAEEAVNVIAKRNKDKSLFLFASFSAPHLPNEAPEAPEAPEAAIDAYADIENINRRKHAAMVSEFDKAVGALFATLEKEDMLDNTMI